MKLIDSAETKDNCYQFLFTINGGWFNGNSLQKYWDGMNFSDVTTNYIHELIFYIVENNVRGCLKTYPLFDNYCVAFFSVRGFADLLAAVWAEMDNREYSYLDFINF